MLFILKENGFCIFRQFWEIWATNEKNFFDIFFMHFFAQKTKSEKNFDANFERKCSLWNACKLNETMDPVFGPGSEK